MVELNAIKEMYEEKIEMETNNRGFISMMLNREESEVWNEFFVDINSYVIYNTDAIVEIPVNEIIEKECFKYDYSLNTDEIAVAIKSWVDLEIDKFKNKQE